MTLDNLIAGNAAFGSNEECNVALADRCSCQAERFRHSVANLVKLERIDATMHYPQCKEADGNFDDVWYEQSHNFEQRWVPLSAPS
jgi:hypothetical protein